MSTCAVVDIGGTTTDIGLLVGGFPRESAGEVTVAGVRTNFQDAGCALHRDRGRLPSSIRSPGRWGPRRSVTGSPPRRWFSADQH
ncbi:hypothetical protein [Propioniciclava flava]